MKLFYFSVIATLLLTLPGCGEKTSGANSQAAVPTAQVKELTPEEKFAGTKKKAEAGDVEAHAAAEKEAELPPIKLTPQQVIEARRKFKIQVVSFDATQEFGTEFPYSDFVRLKVTNDSDVVLQTLTVLTKRFNNTGLMIGSSRAPAVSVGNLKPKQSAEVDFYPRGHLPYVKNITVEIEDLISQDVEHFYDELQAVMPHKETKAEEKKQDIEYPVIDHTAISFDTSESLLTKKFPNVECEQMPNPKVRICRVPISKFESISFLYFSGKLININGRARN